MRLLALLAGFLIAAPAAIAETHLVVSGPSVMADAALLYGCIAYQGCNDTYFTLGPKNARVHIRTDESYAEVAAALGRCDLGLVQSKVVEATDERGNSRPISLAPPPWASPAFGWKVDLFPAVVGLERLMEIDRAYRKYKGAKAPGSLGLLLSEIRMPMRGFSTYFVESINVAKAITEADTHKVRFDSDPIDMEYLNAIMHEFTHVQQWQVFDACVSHRPKIAFWSHAKRERAAYLNQFIVNMIQPAGEGYAPSQLFDEIRTRTNSQP
ncbi:MAG: hypothetical protein JST04_04390 [Bdellovibrionales bacterium]|nr:hypothetical protein [Bdellovibrionales bacterium]